jgi:phage gp36-like protein
MPTSAYAAPSDLIVRYDTRVVGNLLSDNGTTVAAGAIPTNATALALMSDASGELESALLRGQQYSVADLTGLTGNALSYLVRITCDIAFGLLYERRPYQDAEKRKDAVDKKDDLLKMLSDGTRVFGTPGAELAGVAVITGPSYQTYFNQNSVVSRARGNFYPQVRLPYGA